MTEKSLKESLQRLVDCANKDENGYATIHGHLVTDPDPREELCYVMIRASPEQSILADYRERLTLDVIQIFVPPIHRRKGLCRRTLLHLADIAERENRTLRVVAVISKEMRMLLNDWPCGAWKKEKYSNTWWFLP